MPTVSKKGPQRPWQPARVEQQRVSTGFYNTPAWRADRKRHLLEYPLCAECERNGIVYQSDVSDHIVPIRQGGDAWCWSNRQALCYMHHAQKSGRERWGRGV